MSQFSTYQDNPSYPDNSIPANSVYPTDNTFQQCLWETNGEACRKVFLDCDKLADHVRECHTPTSTTHHSCHWKDCPRGLKAFQKRRLLMIHIRAHTGERPLVCSICQETFRRPENLRDHERRHTGEQPYECKHPGCYKRFNTTSRRHRHMLVHQDDKPHHCQFPNCGKSYKGRGALRQHQITNHQHTGSSAPRKFDEDPFDGYEHQELHGEPNQDLLFDTDENQFVLQDGHLETSSADESQSFQDDDVASEMFSVSRGMQTFKKNPTELCQDTYVQPDPHTTASEYLETSSTAVPNAFQGHYDQFIPDQYFQDGVDASDASSTALPNESQNFQDDDVASEMFSDSSRMQTFRKKVEYPTDGKPKQCLWMTNGQICLKVFSDSDGLASHVKECHTPISKKNYICYWKDCPREQKTFGKCSTLIEHVRTHTGERRHTCDMCQMKFGKSSHLKDHKRIHTGKTPFKCTNVNCSQVFSTSSNLTRHLLTHKNGTRFPCPTCRMTYKTSESLKRHLHKGRSNCKHGRQFEETHGHFETSSTALPNAYQEYHDQFIRDQYFQDGFNASNTFAHPSGRRNFEMGDMYQETLPDQFSQPDQCNTDSEAPDWVLSSTGQEDYREGPPFQQNQGTTEFMIQDGALTYETSTSTRQPQSYQMMQEELNPGTHQEALPNNVPPQNVQNKFEESTSDPSNTEDDPIDPTEIWQYFYRPNNL